MTRRGISAKSRAGTFGRRPWARRWMADLESVAGGRGSRAVLQAAVDARHGHVLSLDHSGRTVRLEVRGSRPEPFEVEFVFGPLGEEDARRVLTDLAAAPGGLSAALGGDLDEDTGFRLVPALTGDTEWSCTCPVRGRPCRHVLSAGMILVEWWDRHPEVLFALRGVSTTAAERRVGAGADPFALVDPWGPIGSLPAVPVLPSSGIPDLLDGPVVRRLAAATSNDPLEHLRVVADLDDAYRAFGGGTDGVS